MNLNFISFIFFISLILFSCGKEIGERQESSSSPIATQGESLLKTFYGSMTEFQVEVFYEDGSEPYTGKTILGKDYWDLFKVNIRKVLKISERPISENIPVTKDAMTSFDQKNKASWSVDEAKELFRQLGASTISSGTGVISIAFVSGHFRDSSNEVKKNVTGQRNI